MEPRNEDQKKMHFFQSVQVKYAMTYIVVIAAVLVLLNTYPVLVSQDLVFKSKQTSLQNQATVIVSALSEQENLTSERVAQVMEVLGNMSLTRVLITDPAGLILYDSTALAEDADETDTSAAVRQYALIREVTLALHGKDVFTSNYQTNAFCCAAAAPIIYRNMTIGAVYIYEQDSEQAALVQGVQSNLRSISVVITVVVLIMSWVFSKALTTRIAALLRAIRSVREGEYSHRARLSGSDELTQLAEEFNELTDRLQTTEQIRRRFVSDASHELKTPLASIRLLTDSILQSEHIDEGTTREFVADIGDEAERLTRITEKLLTLTRLDNDLTFHTEREDEPVDVKTVLEKVVHMLAPLAQAGEIKIETELERDCVISCTEDDLYQISFNLIENAVKYNLPGGRVMVGASSVQDSVILTVADTGVGIPEEDQSRIFRRFYRVDKARSRAAGGTGLGLSIVSDTVMLYGGTITVRPREPEGSIFIVTFPKKEEEA